MTVWQDVAAAPGHVSARRRWRFSVINLLIVVFAFVGMVALVYPNAASWVSQYNQSNIIYNQERADAVTGAAAAREKLAQAREYNRLLDGVARYEAGSNIAEGFGESGSEYDYYSMLNNNPTGMMARLKVPSINLDLPVYHGTSDATLLRGVGHLQGTALPVGGDGTRSVLTGHSGLANATIFTNLEKVKMGDSIIVEVLGEVLTYQVYDIRVINPDETMYIKPEVGRDLLTLVTCTPLGINTHRILVTGERITPTPAEDLENAGKRPEVPGFPWWLAILVVGTIVISTWYWRAGYSGAGRRKPAGGRRSTEGRKPGLLKRVSVQGISTRPAPVEPTEPGGPADPVFDFPAPTSVPQAAPPPPQGLPPAAQPYTPPPAVAPAHPHRPSASISTKTFNPNTTPR